MLWGLPTFLCSLPQPFPHWWTFKRCPQCCNHFPVMELFTLTYGCPGAGQTFPEPLLSCQIPVLAAYGAQDGTLYIKMPAVHKATGQLVFMVSPAENSCVASILRDMPELMPYRPVLPIDLDWDTQLVESVPLQINGIVIQDPAAKTHRKKVTQ